MVQLLWKTESSSHIYHALNCPSVRFLPREMKAYVHTETYMHIFVVVLFVVIKTW